MWSTYVLLVVSLAGAKAFSEGAPEEACQDMKPHHHGLRAQKSPAPYTIAAIATETAKAGSPIDVVVSGKTKDDLFRGLLLQARQNGKIIGKFSVPSQHSFLQPLDCGEPGNAVTHKGHSIDEDKQSVTVTWIPPKDFNGVVKFRATVVRDFDHFWMGILSAPLKVSS